ncbi:TonB-dependent receptor domain-containing protein [Saccharicrinis fermentans]|uniref:Vitamin B12/cobalamin outer membrane transporter n=1 Tax=Saccharicrinis fermentans DSM 9555 = JCM 21142 TaxID=869213 RepID=W7YD62_9BACT|nr:TonB-dependent receptor [Saccharicrinis fermentans]GAF05433.1 vitamin B12/cobalamin outer membrane transporter [Saccharicrinis fermentans DSM 9555 = JCM 21142]
MNFKRILVYWLMAILLLTNIIVSYGQQQIRLLDEESFLPIKGATYTYGTQAGISDSNGIVEYERKDGIGMQFSHINYGEWIWTDQQLQVLAKKGYGYRKSISVRIFPVTILAVRSKQTPSLGIKLEYHDRMAHDAAGILNQTPMLNSIRKSGNYGFDPVFRGFKYDQLNIVLNGVQSTTAACPNRMDPPTSQMAPNMIDRIEVLKGPHALRYGTGFGGTVNLVPSKLRFTRQNDAYGRLSSGYQSNGSVLTSEAQIGFRGESYDISLFGAWTQGGDYETGNNQTVQSDFERASFGTNIGLKLGNTQELNVSAIYNRARDVDFPALGMDLRKDDTWIMNARHTIRMDNTKLKSWNTTVFASFVDHLMDNLLKKIEPRMMNARTPASTYNYGARTEGVWSFAKGSLFAGADWRVEGAEGTRTREFLMGSNAGKSFEDNAWQDSYIAKNGFFGEYHLQTGQYHFVFSGRIEVNSAKVNDGSDEFTQVYGDVNQLQVNPSFSVGASRKLNQSTTVGLWLGRAQRSGGLTERFINYFSVGQDPYEMLGNPQLDAEVNNQLDMTVQWLTGKSVFNLDVFASYMQDFISSVIDTNLTAQLATSPGVRRFVNIDKAFKTGFEINWTQRLGAGLQHQLGIAYTYAQDLKREEPLPEIAPLDFRYLLRGDYFSEKLQPELSFRHVMEQSRVSNEFGETKTPSFSLLDVKLSYTISHSIQVSAGVNNLFNENYYEHLSRSVHGTSGPIFAPGRNVFGLMSIRF